MASPRTIDIGEERQRLLSHPLYAKLDDAESMRIFMRFHAFAVWDFLSLLKSLQRRLTCVEVPWSPVSDAAYRRLINQIVLDEESDLGPTGEPQSHFEMYIDAMYECGAERNEIEKFAARISRGEDFERVLESAAMPPGTRRFVATTMRFVGESSNCVLAAVFAYGREEIIPPMFEKIVEKLYSDSPTEWATFRYYLTRHIERDGDVHAPLARKLVADLCWGDPLRWRAAEAAARQSLIARIELWDCISTAIDDARRTRQTKSKLIAPATTSP